MNFIGDRDAVFLQKLFASAVNRLVFYFRVNPASGGHLKGSGLRKRKPSFPRAGRDGLSQRVFAFCLGRGGEGEKALPADRPVKWQDIADIQAAVGQGAGLVKSKGVHLSHFFQGLAGFNDDAVLGGLPDSGHDSGGCGQHQGAGAENHQNRDGGYDVARPEIGRDGNEKGHRHQPARAAVRDALHGSLLILRLLYHADQLLQGAVFPYLCGGDIDGAEPVDGSAEYLIADSLVHGEGFSGHNRLVNGGFPACNDSVHRDAFPGENPKKVALLNFFRGDHLLSAVPQSAPHRRGQADELFQAFLGPVGGGFFQERADGHDKSDLPGCKQIPDGDSSKHCDAD